MLNERILRRVLLTGATLICIFGLTITGCSDDVGTSGNTAQDLTGSVNNAGDGLKTDVSKEVMAEGILDSELIDGVRGPASGGMLQVCSIDDRMQLCDDSGQPIQLKGMSTHGLSWESEIINDNAFKALRYDWDSNVIRLVVNPGNGGYSNNPRIIDDVIKGIELAMANDLYIIVDWHVLYPGDPSDEAYSGAKEFFRQVAAMYPNNPHIIYELANEPNMTEPGVTNNSDGWQVIKDYAEPIIEMLRSGGNKNHIIVGTPNWSQRPDLAAENPIDDANISYTAHFHTGTHSSEIDMTSTGNVMGNIERALTNGVMVFVTEWGIGLANKSEGIHLDAANKWLAYLDTNCISWTNWSLSNFMDSTSALRAYELGVSTAAALNPGIDHYWDLEELSISGEYVRSQIKGIPYEPIERIPVSFSDESAAFGEAQFPSKFEDGTRNGWTWASESGVKSDIVVETINGSSAMGFHVSYPEDKPMNTWQSAPRLILADAYTTREDNDQLTFDLYLKPDHASIGTIRIYLAFAPPELGYWAQASNTFNISIANVESYEAVGDGMYRIKPTFDLSEINDSKELLPDTTLRDITIVITDGQCDYSGMMYLDNISFE